MFQEKTLTPPAGGQRHRMASSKHGDTLLSSSLQRYPYWEPNHSLCSVLTVDMDFSDSEQRLAVACAAESVPLPDYYIVNDSKGTVQASWLISSFPSYLLNNDSPVGWLYHRVLASLRLRLHGDPCFTDGRRRNPYCNHGQRVMISDDMGVHSLQDIRTWLEDRHLFDDGSNELSSSIIVRSAYEKHGVCIDDTVPGGLSEYTQGSRNNAVFLAAVRAARHGDDVSNAAHAVVCVPPLPESEIRNCIRSAYRCAKRPIGHAVSKSSLSSCSDEVRATCAQWGRRGGSANTRVQREARSINLARGRRMTSLKHVMTRDRIIGFLNAYGGAGIKFLAAGGSFVGYRIAALARRVGCSRQTVRRCLEEIYDMILKYGSGQFINMFRDMHHRRGYVAAVAVFLRRNYDDDRSFSRIIRNRRLSLWDYDDIGKTSVMVTHGSTLSHQEGIGIN